MNDPLGDRMKAYESCAQLTLPRRTYTIIRLDGQAFHTYTKSCERPFDLKLGRDLGFAAAYTIKAMSGAQFAYCQSDEISILLTDFDTIHTQTWFGGNVQKLCSIAASMFTAKFNSLRPGKLAHFDARAFTIPDRIEVMNYFRWRNKDYIRNSVSMLARHHFSQKTLNGKKRADIIKMLKEKGASWNKLSNVKKYGRVILDDGTISSAWDFSKDEDILECIPERGY